VEFIINSVVTKPTLNAAVDELSSEAGPAAAHADLQLLALQGPRVRSAQRKTQPVPARRRQRRRITSFSTPSITNGYGSITSRRFPYSRSDAESAGRRNG
jgi:hypothetical protein